MNKVAIVFLAVAAVVAANTYKPPPPKYPEYKAEEPAAYKPAPPAYNKPAYKEEYAAPAKYAFDYKVKDDYTYVDMGHNENRDGDKTKGSYEVILPDGRKQVVEYYVDAYSGFVADVKHEGSIKSNDYKPKY